MKYTSDSIDFNEDGIVLGKQCQRVTNAPIVPEYTFTAQTRLLLFINRWVARAFLLLFFRTQGIDSTSKERTKKNTVKLKYTHTHTRTV